MKRKYRLKVNHRNRTDITELMRAATDEDVTSLVKMLALDKNRSSLFLKDRQGRTALDWARLCRNYHAVTMLHKAMSTSIHDARLNAISSVLDVEEYLRSTNEYQSEVLLKHIMNRRLYETKSLLANNMLYRDEVEGIGEIFFTDKTAHNGYTPLILAAGVNMLEVVNLLVELAAPINHANRFGHTALTYAAASGHSAVVRTLLFRGANIHHRSADGRTCLHYACMYAKAKTVKTILEFLLEQFCMFRASDHSQTEFDAGRWDLYSDILDKFVNVRDNEGNTAFDLIPDKLVTGQEIETRLKLSLVKSLNSLYEPVKDDSSVKTNKSYLYDPDYQYHPEDEPNEDDNSQQLPEYHPKVVLKRTYGSNKNNKIDSHMSSILERNSYSAPSTAQSHSNPGLVEASGSLADFHFLATTTTATNRSGLNSYLSSPQRPQTEATGTWTQSEANADADHDDQQSVSEWGDDEVGQQEEDEFHQMYNFDHPPDLVPAARISNSRSEVRISTVEQTLEDGTEEVSEVEEMSMLSQSTLSHSTPAWSHDTDNMHAIGLHNLSASYTVATGLSLVDEVKHIHELFNDLHIRVQVWRDSAEKERQLSKLISCPLGCGTECCTEDLLFHMKAGCTHRTTRCKLCEAPVQYFNTAFHDRKECPKRLIACPNAYNGCKEMIRCENLEVHVNLKCKVRLMCCRLFCGVIVPLNARNQHEKEHCKHRKINCDVCKSEIVAKDISDHLHNDCPLRKVRCTVGCGCFFKAYELEQHERDVCAQLCRWNCGSRIGPVDKLRLHELMECLDRPVSCCFSCSVPGLTAKTIGWHEQYQCSNLPKLCSRGCGKTVLQSNLHRHSDSWLGDCTERSVRCPSNLVGWMIRVQPGEEEGLVLKYRRTELDLDQWLIKFPKSEVWLNCWDVAPVLLRNTNSTQQADFICGWITFSDLNQHLHFDCGNREVLLTGQTERAGSNFSHGYKTTYDNVMKMVELRNEYDAFVDKATNNPAQQFCEFCSVLIDEAQLDDHKKHFCSDVSVRCPFGCGQQMFRKKLLEHTERHCCKRPATCPRCGDTDLWAEEVDEHLISHCRMRPQVCPYGCGDPNVQVCIEASHKQNECVKRPVQCKCGETMKFDELQEHLALNCRERIVSCPRGCGQEMMFQAVDMHVKLDCKNQNHKYQKEVECPLGCAAKMLLREVMEHVSYHCVKRLTECPLFCGNVVQLDRMKSHLSYCPKRPVSCEKGMKCCEKFFHHWFHREVPSDLLDGMTLDDHATFDESLDSPGNSTSFAPSHDPDEAALKIKSLMYSKPHNPIDAHAKLENTKIVHQSKSFSIQLGLNSTGKYSLVDAVKFRRKDDSTVGLNHSSVHMHTSTMLSVSTSSIFMDGHQMKMHNELRMGACEKHGTTLLMSASRFDQFELGEYIVRQCRESEDIDIENKNGDTALTLACRMGRYKFVELLVQHGADVNKETSTGKTALIEAAKADEENIPILEFLMQSGCIVDYKTAKHRKTAMSWARLLNRKHSMRLLELAGTVQRQTNVVFNAITCGEFEKVRSLIKDGDFFDPNVEITAYKQMEKYAALEETATEQRKATEKKMEGITAVVEMALKASKEASQNVKTAEDDLNAAFKQEEKIQKGILKEFTQFEKVVSRLQRADLEEIGRIQQPSPVLRRAVFVYALIFEVVKSADWMDTAAACADKTYKKWWMQVIPVLNESRMALLRIRAFNIDKLIPAIMKPMVERARLLYADLFHALEDAENKIHRKEQQSLQVDKEAAAAGGSDMKESFLDDSEHRPNSVGATTKASSKPSTGVTSNHGTSNNRQLVEADTAPSSSMNVKSRPTTAQVPEAIKSFYDDEFFDFNEPAAKKGAWIKGEWVPNSELSQTAEQLEQSQSKAPEKFVRITEDLIQSTMKNRPTSNMQQFPDSILDSTNTSSSVASHLVNDANAQTSDQKTSIVQVESFIDDHGANAIAAAAKASLERRRGSKRGNSNLHAKYQDEIEGYHFIESMLGLLKAVSKFSFDKAELSVVRRKASDVSVRLADLKLVNQQLLSAYQEEFENRAVVEKQLIKDLRHERSMKAKVFSCRERVRVARLLNQVSVNGHTLISWAASLGAYDVVDEMLSRGATVGYPAPLLHQIASYLQMSYRISRMSHCARTRTPYHRPKQQRRKSMYDAAEEDFDTGGLIQTTLDLIKEIEELKKRREKLFSAIHFGRTRTRLPVPEAVYAGKWEILQMIYQRRLLHFYFVDSYIYPQAPPPFNRQLQHQYDRRKIGIREILAYGMNDLSAGIYIASEGWVGPGDPKEPYGETQEELNKILQELDHRQAAYIANRHRIRILLRERLNQKNGEVEMAEAIAVRDFVQCMHLAEKRGITIDLETTDGYTALVAASEENVDAINYKPLINADGGPCLAVEYLLDREFYRPSINVETKTGHTALIRACELGRYHAVEALLDRGAELDYVNRFGRTALHYAAATGNMECTRILIERFADMTKPDVNGLIPYHIAERENFVGIMTLLSQFGSGYLGPLQVSRGRVNNTIRCPLGCGLVMLPYQTKEHVLVCNLREVPCPNDCGVQRLMFREVEAHIENDCERRLIVCELCSLECELRCMDGHLSSSCDFRIVSCPLGCGKEAPSIDMHRHTMNCSWRLMDCPLRCGVQTTIAASADHVDNECENRRVPCPLKCHSLVICKNVSQHLESVCVLRPTHCQFCQLELPKRETDAHEKVCNDRSVLCSNKCGTIISHRMMSEHVALHCVNRFALCPMHCGLKVRVSNMEQHQRDQCPNRLILCEFGCYVDAVAEEKRQVTLVAAKLMDAHKKYECVEREVKCRWCVEKVKYKNIADHEEHHCVQRHVPCTVPGCLKVLPLSERDNHERHKCRFRHISCPQGCGQLVTAIHAGVHCQRACDMRHIDCPLGCGVNMRAFDAPDHMKYTCVRRERPNTSTLGVISHVNDKQASETSVERKMRGAGKGSLKTASDSVDEADDVLSSDVSERLRMSFLDYKFTAARKK